jgi:hypothetical protein
MVIEFDITLLFYCSMKLLLASIQSRHSVLGTNKGRYFRPQARTTYQVRVVQSAGPMVATERMAALAVCIQNLNPF